MIWKQNTKSLKYTPISAGKAKKPALRPIYNVYLSKIGFRNVFREKCKHCGVRQSFCFTFRNTTEIQFNLDLK